MDVHKWIRRCISIDTNNTNCISALARTRRSHVHSRSPISNAESMKTNWYCGDTLFGRLACTGCLSSIRSGNSVFTEDNEKGVSSVEGLRRPVGFQRRFGCSEPRVGQSSKIRAVAWDSSLLVGCYFAGGGGRLLIMFIAKASMEPTSATFAGKTSVLLVLASSPNLPMYCSATRNCTAS